MDETVKILLVDDEPRNLDALESILESSDCELVKARTADEALIAILNNEFAAIVLDIKMPGISGLELAQLIKKRKRNQHIPILFLTAHSLEEKEVLQAYVVGGVDFLSKPINPEILRSKVAVFTDLFRTARALALAVEALNAEVAQREKAQEELRLAKEQLETRVIERTAELALANQEVRDNEERLRLALAVAQVATWEWDLVTGRMRWSADPEIVFGFPPGAFGPDSRITHAVLPEDIGAVEESLRLAMNSGDFEAEYRAVRPDGSVVWIADRGRVVKDADRPMRIVGVSVDLTRRKQLEEALLESDRRKDEFLATLAHELRNPLAPVRYAAKILEATGPETPQLRWAVEIIERQVQHMTRLIDDLLDVNRIGRNMLELRRETIDLALVIKTAVESIQPLIEQSGCDLAVDIPGDRIFLDADSVRLSQVFSNILSNGAKFSKRGEGPGKILLTVRREGEQAVVTVKDFGVGISPDLLPRVFEMFTQVGRSVNQSQGGLGIGLSLAKRLVIMHGGTIEAHSEGPGKGCEFTVRLPILETSNSNIDVPAEPLSNAEQRVSKRRILIAEDNPDVVESFRLMLHMLGHEVTCAVDGMEALEKAEQFRPDVIMLDIGMPKLDGYEAARRIRQRPWSRDVVLIAITGWGNEKDKRRSLEAGFNIHLVKPVDVTSILEILDELESKPPGKLGEQNSQSRSLA